MCAVALTGADADAGGGSPRADAVHWDELGFGGASGGVRTGDLLGRFGWAWCTSIGRWGGDLAIVTQRQQQKKGIE